MRRAEHVAHHCEKLSQPFYHISWSRTALVAVPLLLSACGLFSKPVNSGSAFPLIEYRLPETVVKAKIPFTLIDCEDPIKVATELNLEAEAGASAQQFAVTPAALESVRAQQGLEIKLHDTGAIASINSESTDRTGAIIGNIVKVIGSIAGVAVPPDAVGAREELTCNQATRDALGRVKAIDQAISKLRRQVPINPAEYNRNRLMLQRLFQEKQALLSGPLRVELEASFDLASAIKSAESTSYSGSVVIKTAPLAERWLASGSIPDGRIVWKASPAQGEHATLPAHSPAALCAASTKGICFAEPIIAVFTATASFSDLQLDGGAGPEANKRIPMPQWGKLRELSTLAAVGASRKTGIVLDKFGRATEMKWSSEARAENLTSTAAAVASQVQTIVSASSTVNQQKAEIEELTTQQQLNRLRACKEILEGGGSQCPAEAELPAEPE